MQQKSCLVHQLYNDALKLHAALDQLFILIRMFHFTGHSCVLGPVIAVIHLQKPFFSRRYIELVQLLTVWLPEHVSVLLSCKLFLYFLELVHPSSPRVNSADTILVNGRIH